MIKYTEVHGVLVVDENWERECCFPQHPDIAGNPDLYFSMTIDDEGYFWMWNSCNGDQFHVRKENLPLLIAMLESVHRGQTKFDERPSCEAVSLPQNGDN
jgi:hypothetical protein